MSKSKELALAKTQGMLQEILSRSDMNLAPFDMNNLEDCERLIDTMAKVRRASGLVIALMLVHIRDGKLFGEGQTWERYRANSNERIGINRQDVWKYERIGDAFVMYRTELEKIGFREHGDTTKLIFLNEAVVKHGKRAAFANFGTMSKIEFELWARNRAAKIPYKGKEFGVTEKALLFNDHEIITFAEIRDIATAGNLDEFRRMVKTFRR